MAEFRQDRMSPWVDRGLGFGAGIAADRAYEQVKQAKSRANWALGIGIGVAGLTLVNSGNVQAQAQNAVNIANSVNGLAFTAGGATGAEVGALRAQVANLASVVGQGLYYANPWSFFSTQPPQVTGNTAATASTASTAVTSNTNNSGLALILLIGIGAAAIALS